MSFSIEKRQEKYKEQLLEQLKKTPVVHVACDKAGVGRATYYRWRKEDLEFAKKANEAMLEGSLLINDMAESQLISAIKDKNLGAITYWLKHHHPTYTTRVEIDAKLKMDKESLTSEQEALVKKALRLAGLLKQKTEEGEDEQ